MAMSVFENDRGSTPSNLSALRSWFTARGGTLHHSLLLSPASESDLRKGASIQVSSDVASVPQMTTLLCAPFETTISTLSIPLIAPFWPITFLDGFAISPQILARFVLLEAWLQGEKSAWWPYLRALPQPKSADIAEALGREPTYGSVDIDPVETPLYWNADDRAWLRGTRLETATAERETLWREELAKARKLLREANLSDVDRDAWKAVQPRMWEAYTWPLYLWATTLLTSRSFPSKLLAGWQPAWDEDTAWGRCEIAKAWRKGGISRKFPVMFPALDLGNHDPKAKVEWDCDGGSLKLITHERLLGGTEMYNNYGPKSNDELIVGYGFLLEDNEDDQVMMAVSTRNAITGDQTPHIVQSNSKETVLSENRGLRRVRTGERDMDVIPILRGALSLAQAHTLALQLANQREMKELASVNNVAAFYPAKPTRCVALLVDRTILALQEYRDRLEGDAPAKKPETERQRMAAMFRVGQIDIIEQNVDQLETFLLSLQKQKQILTLNQILSDESVSPEVIRQPLRSIMQYHLGQKPKLRDIAGNGLFEFCFVSWLCLLCQKVGVWNKQVAKNTALDWGGTLTALIEFLNREYSETLRCFSHDEDSSVAEQSPLEASILAASDSYYQLLMEYARKTDLPYAADFASLTKSNEMLRAATYIWRQESVTFESLDRLLFNGETDVHEEFLFIEASS